MSASYRIEVGTVVRTLHGPRAAQVRRAVKSEQSALLARYDAGERVELLSHEGVEEEVGRRLAAMERSAA